MNCDLIIPAFNEVENIEALFDALDALHDVSIRHIILADNGSNDGTGDAAAARGAIVVHEPRRGYGAACLAALQWIDQQTDPPDIVAFLDADLSDDPNSLPKILTPIFDGRTEMVIGSRVRLADRGALNPVQRFGNALACRLIHFTTGRRYTDLGPMRACRWKTLQQLNMSDRTWGWTVEMQMKAALLNINSLDVDVPYHRRRMGQSKISGTVRGVVKAGTKIICTIVKLWWRRSSIRPAVS